MKKTIAALLLGIGLAVGAVGAAQATDEPTPCVETPAYDEIVVDSAEHWQRYSWTGGPHTADSAPEFPSDDWQPNVQGDPHSIGGAGAYFRSHGNAGNGDWFYLELVPATSHVVHYEAVTCEPTPESTETSTPDPEPTETGTPPVEEPPVLTSSTSLAITGFSEDALAVITALGILLLAGGTVLVLKGRRV